MAADCHKTDTDVVSVDWLHKQSAGAGLSSREMRGESEEIRYLPHVIVVMQKDSFVSGSE